MEEKLTGICFSNGLNGTVVPFRTNPLNEETLYASLTQVFFRLYTQSEIVKVPLAG